MFVTNRLARVGEGADLEGEEPTQEKDQVQSSAGEVRTAARRWLWLSHPACSRALSFHFARGGIHYQILKKTVSKVTFKTMKVFLEVGVWREIS